MRWNAHDPPEVGRGGAHVENVARGEAGFERGGVKQNAEPGAIALVARDHRIGCEHGFREVERVLAPERERHEVRDARGAVAPEPAGVVHLSEELDRIQPADERKLRRRLGL